MKYLHLFLLCFGGLAAQAQQLRPDVLASAGTSMSNAANTARLSFTIGEVAIQGQSLPTLSYGQGFHNGALQTVRVTELDLVAWGIEVWPNPVGNTLFLQYTPPATGDFLTASVWNLLGQAVLGAFRLDDLSEKSIRVESLPSGVYLLRLTDSSGKSAAIKIVKAG
ncbi:MAG: T9SS type A sorting domain-containing protein [Phycisphaerae bacterium]|nr:T9SS type A sorting domain-containing protein [Saprospiraceae bacterium]